MVGEMKFKEGYKKTEVGVIPEDWEVVSLNEIIDYTKGYAFKSSEYKENGVRIIRVSDTDYDSIKSSDSIYIDENDYMKYRNWSLKENDLILSTVGSKPPMYNSMVGKVVKVDAVNSGSLLNQNAVKISARNQNDSTQLLIFNNLKTKGYLTYIEKIFRGNANQASITLKELFEYQIALPKNSNEQKAIAKALTDTDNLIHSIQNLIDKKEKIKKATMQELLTGKKRLDGFSGEWEVNKLGDIADLTSSKRIFSSDYVKSGIPFYRGKEIQELNKGLDIKDLLYISIDKYESIKKKYGIPTCGDILISAVGSLGNIFRVPNENPFYFKDGNLIWLKNIKPNSLFLKYLLEFYNDKLLDTAIGSSQKALTMANLSQIEIRIPPLAEQKVISKILSDMDQEIQGLKEKLEKYKTIKQGMMQELLTGRIRLI